MTAFADLATYKAAVLKPKQMTLPFWSKNTIGNAALPLTSWWRVTGAPGATSAPAIPTTATALDNTTAGALDSLVTDSLSMWLTQMEFRSGLSADSLVILCDRLSHTGGLDGTVTPTAQTTNLPTAALTRYTTGAGVMAGLEIYSALGSQGVLATVSYTNQAGAAGQTSQSFAIGGSSGGQAVGRVLAMPLASGDTGVRAVASVSLAASTLSAGNFGVTLFKPLMMTMVPAGNTSNTFATGGWFWDALYSGGGNLPQIQSGACLALMVMCPTALGNTSSVGINPVIGLA